MSTIPKDVAKRGLRSWRTWLAVLYWLGFLLFLPGIVVGQTRGIALFPALILGTLASRSWCYRCGVAILSRNPGSANRDTIRFYVKTLWSYAWRSFLVFALVGLLVGFATNSAAAAGAAMGVSFGIWIICSVFTVDVPYWVLRGTRSYALKEFAAVFVCGLTLVTVAGYVFGHSNAGRSKTLSKGAAKPSTNVPLSAKYTFELGKAICEGNPVQQDYSNAVSLFQQAVELGSSEAAFYLGVCSENGKGLPQDYRGAFEWYLKAAEGGVAEAEYNLAECFFKGRGIPKNDGEAVKWFTKAADHGVIAAQYNLGIMYESGQGVAKNDERAAKWYLNAANAGDALSQSKLGFLYSAGQGVSPSDEQAAAWLRKAALQGDASAQNNLAKVYWSGRGAPKDIPESLKWLILSANQGYDDAIKMLGQLKRVVSADVFEEGQRRAGEFKLLGQK